MADAPAPEKRKPGRPKGSKAKPKPRGDAKKQFVVGRGEDADFTPEYIEALTLKIAMFYSSPECDRTYDDPLAQAKQKVRECLLAETADGSPWRNVPASFTARVKAKCAWDIDNDRGIPSSRVKHPDAVRALNKAAQKGAVELSQSNPLLDTFDQEAFRARMEADLLAEFPELNNAAHLPNVRSLTMYYAEREKIDAQLRLGVSDAKRLTLLQSLDKIEGMADQTMKRLGVHPDQIRKKVSDKASSSVADLAALVSDDEGYRRREKIWALQEALQLWWMSEHLNGKQSGPQLHPFEVWHRTRTRPVKFTCRHGETYTVVEGFEPKDLYDWLVAEGVLVEEPVNPHLVRPEELAGLDAYFRGSSAEVVPDTAIPEESDGDAGAE